MANPKGRTGAPMKEPTKGRIKDDLNGMFGRAVALELALKAEIERRIAAELKLAKFERILDRIRILSGKAAK
jgi:hypothetical protein